MKSLCASLLAALVLGACVSKADGPAAPGVEAVETIALFDGSRNRAVPVVLYHPAGERPHRLAILSHGYGAEPTSYGFIARRLAERGWLVAAIDHDLPGDPPVPRTGEPLVVRMPNWRIGADSIGFAARELRARGLADDRPILLVGHSNGGDMAMLYAGEHPDTVGAVISLDNRRMPFPNDDRVQVLSLRSSDQVADPGVIPEKLTSGTSVMPVAVIHNHMSDEATPAQKSEMEQAIDAFLDRIGF